MADISIQMASDAWGSSADQVADEIVLAAGLALELASWADGSAIDEGAELSLVLSDDAAIQELNKTYRGFDKPTNVLSFPSHILPGAGLPVLLGDVVLSYETVCAQAAAQGKTLEHHAQHLTVHGVLHLLGYDHQDEAEAAEMESLEVMLLEKLGVANPYLITSDVGVSHG